MKHYDVAIIGGGPGGSTLGTYLAMQGLEVAIFERESYPRFHIGESLLPASMPILMETGFYETLNSGKYIRKYGARFVDCESSNSPGDSAESTKSNDEIYFGFDDSLRPEFPMAFEVIRSEFDKDLLDHACKAGVNLFQPERVKEVHFFDSHVLLETSEREYRAKFVVDASGRDSFIGKKMAMRHVNRDLNNVAVFAHFHHVKRSPGKNAGDIIIGLLPNRAWSWMIPFQGERTSVGVVCSSEVFKKGTDLGVYLDQTLKENPKLAQYMAHAERVSEITAISNYSHTTESFVGDRWILIGDAAVFLDPIFSSGVHIALSTARFASQTLIQALNENLTLREKQLDRTYEANVRRGVDRFHSLISLFYQGGFVPRMKKTLALQNARKAFTGAVTGDMWNEDNFIFQRNVL